MNRDDFQILKSGLVYLDNGATTLKPKCVIDKIIDYYTNYPSNAHRGDYKISLKASSEYELSREKLKDFINAESKEEIVFTSGSTESLNMIVNGYFRYNLSKDDEVLITKAEHASNILPWYELENKIGIKVNYIPLTKEHTVSLDNVKKSITDKTKVISIAHVSNVIGDVRPIKEIIKYAHEKGILVVIDGAQSVGHINVDVKDLDIDFMAMSAHKMCGPTGIGALYAKYNLLDKIVPYKVGGGMNVAFTSPDNIQYMELPYKLEAGTQNIEGVIGYANAIDYIKSIGIDNIEEYTDNLKKYLVDRLKEVNNINIYNANIEGSTLTFNIKNVFAQDTSIYLDKHNIAVRSGEHCAKKLDDELGIKNTVRVSLYFYNNKEDIDKLVSALKNDNILEESLGI